MLSKDYNIINPRIIVALKNLIIKSISCGHRHSVALTVDGKMLAWGDNQFGQLGNRNNSEQNKPQKYIGDEVFIFISLGTDKMLISMVIFAISAWLTG